MHSTCPKVSDGQWVSMNSSSTWLTTNIIPVQDYLNAKKPSCIPETSWCIVLFSTHVIALESKLVFDALQGLIMLLSQQIAKLSALINTYCRLSKMQGAMVCIETQWCLCILAKSGSLGSWKAFNIEPRWTSSNCCGCCQHVHSNIKWNFLNYFRRRFKWQSI